MKADIANSLYDALDSIDEIWNESDCMGRESIDNLAGDAHRSLEAVLDTIEKSN